MNTVTGESRILSQLRSTYGFNSFRPLQREIVEASLSGRSVFALMPTGGGKSLCYQLPALLREGVTVVVSPLIALMKDQVDRLQSMGVSANFINSTLMPAQVAARQAQVAGGALKLLYVAPERLMTPGFLRFLDSVRPAGFAIDEAHCISEWGHDFRPEYRELRRLRQLFPATPVAAFTATATRRVQADILTQLGLEDAAIFKGSFDRANLFYEVRPKRDADAEMIRYLRKKAGCAGIIYCQARATTEALAARLRMAGVNAAAYHAGLEADERRQTQEAFIRGELQVIVATIAFGMGIDKPDVRFVVHYDLPKNLEGFYQESGRAGRDGLPSDCILFYSYADVAKQEYFIKQRPSDAERQNGREQLRRIVAWAEGRQCRRRTLLEYFDDQLRAPHDVCCDVCRGGETRDATAVGQALLSCVRLTDERFGVAYLIRVLRGSRDARILQAGHDGLPVYGSGRALSRPEWHRVADGLAREGYVQTSADEFRVLRLTARGRAALTQGEAIRLPLANERALGAETEDEEAEPPAAPLDSGAGRRTELAGGQGEQALFEQLRLLRKRLADERGLSAFVIFHDTSLRQMAHERPRTREQLRRIHGMGERKLMEFGDAILQTIASFRQEPAVRVVAVGHPPGQTTGLPATVQETLALFREGLDSRAISARRGLAPRTVTEQLARAIEAGEDLDLERLVSDDKRRAIEVAIGDLGPELLKPLKERLGDGYSYDEIGYVRAIALRERRAPGGR